jgi:hypothetical protein
MEPSTAKPIVMVLMPFEPAFEAVYRQGVLAACQEAETACLRLDEQIFEKNALEGIQGQLAGADIIVADASGRNPNVFYEVGYAQALGKTVILLADSPRDIPFDLRHYRHIVYADPPALKDRLLEKIRYVLATKGTTPDPSGRDLVDSLAVRIEGKDIRHEPLVVLRHFTSELGRIFLYDFRVGVENTGMTALDVSACKMEMVFPSFICLHGQTSGAREVVTESYCNIAIQFGDTLFPGQRSQERVLDLKLVSPWWYLPSDSFQCAAKIIGPTKVAAHPFALRFA